MLTQKRLKSLMSYDANTGEFRWSAGRSGTRLGCSAGYIHRDNKTKGLSYRRIEIDGKEYGAHRLAWLYSFGRFPGKGLEIDHRNRNSLDNRIDNLRVVTKSINKRNSRPFKGRKYKGVYRQASGSFYVAVRYNKKLHYGGTFTTAELANAVAEKLHSQLGMGVGSG